MQKIKQIALENWLWVMLVVLGIVLRLRQYLFNRALWNDEASLALNLVTRSFIGLTQPLDNEQGSPIAFLWIIKFFMTLFGDYDYVLRLFPLIAGVAGLFLLMHVARVNLGGAGLLALAVWAVSPSPVYFSNELKQYSSDALAVLLLLYLAHFCLADSTRRRNFIILGLTGALTLWVSHPSAFILAAIGIVIFIGKVTGKIQTPYGWIFSMGAAWVLSFALGYVVSLQHLVANDFLQGYWNKAFLPLPPWSNKRWFLNTYFYLVSVTTSTTDWTLGITLAALAGVGAISLLWRNGSFGLILMLTFAFTGLASALHKYPLKDRFILFLAPLFLFLIAEAVGALYRVSRKITPRFALVLPLLLSLFIFSYVTSGLNILSNPTTRAEIKPVLAFVAQNQKPGDTVYVYYTAVTSYLYYAPFYGIQPENTVLGFRTPNKKQALDAFYDEVDALAGRERVWFVFADIVYCDDCQGDMHDFYGNYLDTLGARLQNINSIGARGYLYDLRP